MWVVVTALLFVQSGITQDVGEQCRIQHTGSVGRCAFADQCQSARDDYRMNGIRPSYCSQQLYAGVPLVCCRDHTTILQTTEDSRPHHHTDKRRVSERKCEEYSRGVMQTVGFIPLIPEPEEMTISAAKCDYTGVQLIVGGESANQGEFPHMAAVGWVTDEEKYAFYCGGTLISSRFVLTAGHCTYKPRQKHNEPSVVRLGEQNLDPTVRDGATPIDVPIKQIHKHPGYKPPSKYDDVALLELVTDVDFTNDVRPACLWNRDSTRPHTKALATGWGVVDPQARRTSTDLQKVSLTLFDNNSCNRLLEREEKRHWERGVIDTQVCAGELRGGKDTCQGDSGSPLQVASSENQCIFHVIGITSFGGRCAQPGRPAVYTRVSKYLNWIESIVWPGE
ncbi:serine protease snake-like [Aricia agestis]|uniref:serine protease snake-like n=1 Tax=Aricia agestis TaxID=91739 RepID=UPI001C20C1BD|nr:serine protease snake-like [Aricia agestis]XP_041983785.1 serine protease snake-like [Aricia agestis]